MEPLKCGREESEDTVEGTVELLQSAADLSKDPAVQAARLALIYVKLLQLAADLSKGINYVSRLLDNALKDPKNRMKYYLEAASLSCRMLEEVISNENFRGGIRKLAKVRKENEPEFAEMLLVDKRFDEFLDKERRLISRVDGLGKVDGLIVDNLIADYRQVRQALMKGEARSGDVYEAIERIRLTTCKLAQNLRNQTPLAKDRERTRKILTTSVIVIGSVIAIILNATTDSLSPVETAVSGIMGGGVIQKVTGDIIDLI